MNNAFSIKRKVRNKLKTESGASISFALLLFLVCAILSAVILVAGTTAAGRVSSIADTDQRYYAVTSAAEMLVDLLDDNVTVSVIDAGGKVYTIAKPMSDVTETDLGISTPDTGSVDSDQIDSEAETTVKDSDKVYGQAGGGISDFTKQLAELALADENQTGRLSLSQQGVAGDSDTLAVTVDERFEDGKLTMTVYNKNLGRPYKMILDFSADIKDVRPSVTQVNGKTINSAKEVTWHLVKMQSAYDNTIYQNID